MRILLFFIFLCLTAEFIQAQITIKNVEVNFTNRGEQTDFVLRSNFASKIGPTNAWLGVGLNSNAAMSGASVVVCKNLPGQTAVQHYYNNEYYSSSLLNPSIPSLGLSSTSVTVDQGYFICKFTRDNSNSDPKYFNLNKQSPFILIAYGAGDIQNHGSNRGLSSTTIEFPLVVAPTTTKTSTTSTNITTFINSTITSTSSTILSTSIVSNTTTKITTPVSTTTIKATVTIVTSASEVGSYNAGPTTINWKNGEKTTFFAISGAVSAKRLNERAAGANVYYSFGFSKDQKMGADDVAVCKMVNGVGSVEHYYNNGKTPQLMDSTSPSIGFSNAQVTFVNNVLKCSFTREKSMPNVNNYFDAASEQYYFLTANGNTDNSGNIQYHTSRQFSADKIDLTTSQSYSGVESNQGKAKAHGCLMVVAWILFASTGILVARYYKHLLPSKMWCGVKFWFVLHRPIMASVPILSLIAFLVILSDLDWKWIQTDEKLSFAHSIFGIVTMCLSIVQVFLTFFRCDPSHSKRFIFNIAHRSIGLGAFLLSVVTLFLGVTIKRMKLGSSGWGILIGWAIWTLLLPLAMEAGEIFFVERNEDYQVNQTGQIKATISKSKKQLELIKTILLFAHLIVALAFTIALIVVIAIA